MYKKYSHSTSILPLTLRVFQNEACCGVRRAQFGGTAVGGFLPSEIHPMYVSYSERSPSLLCLFSVGEAGGGKSEKERERERWDLQTEGMNDITRSIRVSRFNLLPAVVI